MSKIAIIGSSPLMIMNAIDLAKKGHEVAVFDKAKFGGAWAAVSESLSTYKIDSGVHFLYYQRGLNKKKISLLNSKYNLGIIPMAISPVGDRGIFNFNYPEFSFGSHWCCRKKIRSVLTIIERYLRKKTPYYYFLGGCFGLQQRMFNECKIAGIRFINEKVLSIQKKLKYVSIASHSSVRKFDNVILSSRSLSRELKLFTCSSVIKNQSLDNIDFLHKNSSRLIHVFIEVSNPGPQIISVFKYISGQPIFAVSDVRSYIGEEANKKFNRNNITIFSFAMNDKYIGKDIDSLSLLNDLIERKLCSSSAKLKSEFRTTHTGFNIPKSYIDEVNLIGEGKIYAHRYDNLAKAIIEHLVNPMYDNLDLEN